MKILIGVDGSVSSLDAVRMVGQFVDPSRDEVAVYFSPMELEKRLLGRSRRIVDGAAAALFEEACSLLPGGFAKPVEMIASSKSAAVGLLEAAAGWRADLLVVGARGHGSVERFLRGRWFMVPTCRCSSCAATQRPIAGQRRSSAIIPQVPRRSPP